MLKPKQKRFCEEYIKDLNGTAAATRAGYTSENTGITASRLLKYPHVQEYLKKLQAKTSKRNLVTVDELINDLKEIKGIDIGKLYDDEGLPVHPSQLPPEFTKCIQEIQEIPTKYGHVTKVKFYSRVDAIEKLAKHLGFYEKDNNQSKPEIQMNIIVDSKETGDEFRKLIDGAKNNERPEEEQ